MRRVALATLVTAILFSISSIGPSFASDLVWEVENPFRFFKRSTAFDMHAKAFADARGSADSPLPADIVWRTERRLNDPDCRDRSTPESCGATRRARYEASRLGWASLTLDQVCYERNARPRRYPVACERQYSWGTAKEDYILPDAHTVVIQLAPAALAEAANGECIWVWQPRGPNSRAESRKQACKDKLTIRRVPFAQDRKASGVSVKVKLPNERELTEDVVVEDLFIVSLGDSFASGESNPDRPVTFSATREMTYDPMMTRDDQVATRSIKEPPKYGVASFADPIDYKTLPRRKLEDEEKGLIFRPTSREFVGAFEKRAAQWLSADCHRSQYGYPVRVALSLAMENRHRSITFVHLACSGSEVTEGLFLPRDPREGANEQKTVTAQFDQLSDLICRNGAAGRTMANSYALPMYKSGSAAISVQQVSKHWCPPAQRKRAIDFVLLSIGGNDVGFSAIALNSMTESAGDLAPVANLIGSEIRYTADIARAYLGVLDQRLKAVRDALHDGFGVEPSRVVQTAYEPIHLDETGNACGLRPTLGLDVHQKFKMDYARVQEAGRFLGELSARLECISDAKRRADCPRLATGAGTGFRLVTEHIPKFSRRGLCARDPKRADIDGTMMGMPRRVRGEDFKPYSPAFALPYGARWRLVHTPNDAFLTANTHRDGISPFDILQPPYVSLWSGAFHPTAEGHSIVADSVLPHIRSMLDKRDLADANRR
jgi:lysophospholipase L1-like esterase